MNASSLSPAPLNVAVVGAGSIGRLLALKLREAGHDVTMVVRNDRKRQHLQTHGLIARSRITRRRSRVDVTLVPALTDEHDLVIAAVQRPSIDDLIPTLAANRSAQIMFMFNCAAGADHWIEEIGPERQLWGFPAVLADIRDEVLEYVVLPSALRFVQITIVGRPDGTTTPELERIRRAFRKAGIPTVSEPSVDAWLKTHAAFIMPIVAAGYLPQRRTWGPRLTWSQARIPAQAMKQAFRALEANGVRLTPLNMRLTGRLPEPLLATVLWTLFLTPIAKRSVASLANSASREVEVLLDELLQQVREAGTQAHAVEQLAGLVPARASDQ